MQPLSQLSLQAGSSDSAPFPEDFIPYEPWVAQVVTKDVARLLTTHDSHGPELGESLTLLVQAVRQNNQLLIDLIQTQKELALAIREDGQDDDPELPRTYMDGTPI